MSVFSQRVAALMDGPPPRTPQRVVEGMALRGKRILVNADDGQWHGDIRAVDDPYWMDDSGVRPYRWLPGGRVPEGADENKARLFVSACTEPDWYEWGKTKRRPKIVEYPATLVWVE